MEIGIIVTNKILGRTIFAHSHIGKFIQEMTGGEIIDQECGIKKYDILFVVAGSLLYCNFRDTLIKHIDIAGKVIYCENDYAINYPYKRKPDEIWSTIERPETKYINWNALTFNRELRGNVRKQYTDCLFYYGAFRKGRIDYFKKYFDTDKYKVRVSTAKKKRFAAISRKIKLMPTLKTPAHLGLFQTSIYIEDKKSHDTYMSPANRFYEMLSNGVAIAVDGKAAHTLKKAGIPEVDKFTVNNPDEVKEFIKNGYNIEIEQNRLWGSINYRGMTKERFNELFKTI